MDITLCLSFISGVGIGVGVTHAFYMIYFDRVLLPHIDKSIENIGQKFNGGLLSSMVM